MGVFDYLFDMFDESRETLTEAGVTRITIDVNDLVDERVTQIFVYSKDDDANLEVISNDIENETGYPVVIKSEEDFDSINEVTVYEE